MRNARMFVLALVTTLAVANPPETEAVLGSSQCGPDLYVSLCIADNYVHTVHSVSVRSDIEADMFWILNQRYNVLTELLAVRDYDMNADVRAFSLDYGAGSAYHAAIYCPTFATKYGSNPNVVCRPQQIRFNLHFPAKYDSQGERRAIACHELGHSVGLHHRNHLDSCMEAVPYVDTLIALDIFEINQKYYPY